MNTIFKILYVFIFNITCCLYSYAQTYPVTLNTQLMPPFSGYLPDYSAAGNEKLKVLLTFNDFSKPNYQVKLKIKIEGQGITIQSKPFYFEGPFTLDPGVPLFLSGSDIGNLLNSNNLDFSGISRAQYEQRKVLPEGFYSICITAYDNNNPNAIAVSNTSCAYGMMVLSDPPYLNLPFCGSSVPQTNPQQITFNWTPINQASPNSAGQTDYVFELFEIRPSGQNPNSIVHTLPPIYTETLSTTSLNYGITETPLINAMDYVWRVWAIDQSGRDLFKNQGYSQICTFSYGNSYNGANLNINLTAQAVSHRQIKAQWDSLNLYTYYKLEFQKVGGTSTWFPVNTSNARTRITSLEPNTNYKLRVKGQLPDGSWGPQSNEVTVSTANTPNYACGEVMTPFNMQGFVPLTNATAGMIWDIGQFEVIVTSLQNPMSPTGQYSGTGRVRVGFAGGIPFPVSFTGITVSDDMRIVAGKVDVISRGIDAWLNQNNSGGVQYNGSIDSIRVNTNGTITIYGSNGTTTQTPTSFPTVVTDQNGNATTVYSDGTIAVDGINASSVSSITYPFKKNILCIFDGKSPGVYYYNSPKLSGTLEGFLESLLLASRQQNGNYPDLLISKEVKGIINDANALNLVCKSLYRPNATDPAFFAVLKDTVKWMLNGTEIKLNYDGSLVDKTLLKKGDNIIELLTRSSTEKTFTKIGQFNAQFGLTDLSYYKVRVKRINKPDKDFFSGQVVGDPNNGGQLKLEINEKIQLQLFEKDASNTFIPVLESEFVYNNVSEKTDIKTITIDPLINYIMIKKDLVELKLEFQINNPSAVTNVQNNILNLDVSELSTTMGQDRVQKYASALEKIKKKDITYYNLITGSSMPFKIKVVPNTNSEMSGAIAQACNNRPNCSLAGYAVASLGYTNLNNIELENIKKTGNTILDADMVIKLNNNEKDVLNYAISHTEQTAQYLVLREKINKYNSAHATQLDNLVNSGTTNVVFINTLKYKIEVADVNKFLVLTFDQKENIILLNNTDGDLSSVNEFTKTLAHEIKHVSFKVQNQFIALKWQVLRAKKNIYNYDLGDSDTNNTCTDCSSGCGHEINNPENKEVCGEECKY